MFAQKIDKFAQKIDKFAPIKKWEQKLIKLAQKIDKFAQKIDKFAKFTYPFKIDKLAQ